LSGITSNRMFLV